MADSVSALPNALIFMTKRLRADDGWRFGAGKLLKLKADK
jgi:hypothetical protein